MQSSRFRIAILASWYDYNTWVQEDIEATLFGGYFITQSEGLDTRFAPVDVLETLAEATAIQEGQFRQTLNSGKVDRTIERIVSSTFRLPEWDIPSCLSGIGGKAGKTYN
jgi:hypothetical protein